MRLRSLRLHGFRNYSELEFCPAEGLNILVGENAQGKTNLLEAIYVLATTRSLRASRESELVRKGDETALIHADVERERDADVELEVAVYQTDKKLVKVNGVKRARVLELLGQLNVVHFSALDLGIVSADPSVRRRYLNIEISQISPKYVFDLASYKKALEQRNRLLRDMRERSQGPNGSLDAWSEQLVQHGAPIVEKRRFFIERLAPLADEIHRELTEGRESLIVRYLPSAGPSDSEASAAEALRREMQQNAGEEIRRGITLVGPQRDDIQFLIDGSDARTYGSQGQQRTVVLSLKLAQFRLMEEYVGEPPVMLLDDVLSDLDDLRRAHLLAWIRRRCQTLLTCTALHALPEETLAVAAIFNIAAGIVSPVEAATRP